MFLDFFHIFCCYSRLTLRFRIKLRRLSCVTVFLGRHWLPEMGKKWIKLGDTVDGRNPAPVGRWFIPWLYHYLQCLIVTYRTYSYQLVQDFFHPQYDPHSDVLFLSIDKFVWVNWYLLRITICWLKMYYINHFLVVY